MTLPPMKLASDGAIAAPQLMQFLADQAGEDATRQELAKVVRIFARAAIPLAARLGQGGCPAILPPSSAPMNPATSRRRWTWRRMTT